MSTMPIAQAQLSEELLLLHQFGYSDLDVPSQFTGAHSNKETRDGKTHVDLRMLDIIAVCLTTRQPGDVVAAAFGNREHISLVLAKNGGVLAADRTAADTFFSALKTAKGWIDLLPFLVRHSKANMDKRIRNLHQSLTNLLDDL